MALRIGLFSLRDKAGCTSMAIHMANYLAGSDDYSVALVEKLAIQRESEYANINMARETDGTYIINNVRYYPADSRVRVIEDVVIYDIGTINAVYKLDEVYDKIYLCTDNDCERIPEIISFREDTGIEFDCILFGASRDQISVYSKNGLKSVLVSDKKEERLDYNMYLILSQFVRVKGFTPPEYHKDWTYAATEFTGFVDPKDELENRKRRRDRDKRKRKVEQDNEEDLDKDLVSEISVVKKDESYTSNSFDGFYFEDILEPEDYEEVDAKEVVEEIPHIAESVEDNKIPPRNERRRVVRQEELIFDDENSVMARAISRINRDKKLICNIFLVTKYDNLFIFPDVNEFFTKLSILKREIRNEKNVHYVVLSYNDSGRTPAVITDDEELTDAYAYLSSLDMDIRNNPSFDDYDLRKHKELILFNEILYA